ncbi:hypothetical protein EB001_18800 [bacterium]|nr:hypothetical protein [bacterium]
MGSMLSKLINDTGLFSQINPQPTQPAGITSLPVTTQPVDQVSAPITPVRGFNQVRDPRLNRISIRPMFRSSITSVKPTQQEIDNFVNRPIAIGQMIPINEFLPGEDYTAYIKRKRRETGPAIFSGSTSNITPGTGGFPGSTSSQQEFIKEAIMSLPITKLNPQINTVRRLSQVRDPRIARLLQQRQNRARGGIMNLKVGGLPAEMDFRASGGFVPIGKKERADDVPARLSKNEFVFTANAVRNAGGGDIRKGAKRMYNLMHQLEAKR